MKYLLSVLIVFFSHNLLASKNLLSVKGGTWSFSTENVTDTSESTSGVGAYAFELGYALFPSWLVSFGFNLVMSDLVSGSSGYGVDLGTRYYPLTNATSQIIKDEMTSIRVREVWRPYMGLFMRQRIFGLNQSVSYLGPGLSAGLDMAFWSQTSLSLEFRYDYLYGRGDAIAVQNNILLGIAIEL